MKREYIDLVDDSPPKLKTGETVVTVDDYSDCVILSSPPKNSAVSGAVAELEREKVPVVLTNQTNQTGNMGNSAAPSPTQAPERHNRPQSFEALSPRDLGSPVTASKTTSVWDGFSESDDGFENPALPHPPYRSDSTTTFSQTSSETSQPQQAVKRRKQERTESHQILSTASQFAWDQSSQPSRTELVLAADQTKEELPNTKNGKTSSRKRTSSKNTKSTGRGIKVMTDRKETAKELTCVLWSDSEDWTTQLKPALEQYEITVRLDLDRPRIPGVALVVSMFRNIENRWDETQRLFVPSEPHIEHEHFSFVVLEFSAFENVVAEKLESQHIFFSEIQRQIGHHSRIIWLIPGVTRREHKSVAALNRQVRKRVIAGESGGSEEWSPLAQPVSFADAEIQLQVRLGLRLVYPRSDQDCVEWLANLVVDTSFSRYRSRYTEMGTASKSGSTVRECAMESITQIQGVAPRTASKILDRYTNIGGILAALKHERPQRVFSGLVGDGSALSIASLLCCSDPDQLVTTSHA